MSEFNFKKYVENNPLLKENQDLKETLDDEVLAMAEKMVEMMGAEAVVNAIVRAMSTDDAKLLVDWKLENGVSSSHAVEMRFKTDQLQSQSLIENEPHRNLQ